MNSSPARENSDTGIKVSPAVIGCVVLLVSFFLPWISLLGGSVAGYEIGKLSNQWQWLWAIPIVSGIAILLGLAGKRHIEVAQIAGGLPLVALTIAGYQGGRELFSALLFGAYLALITGVYLVVVVPRLGRKAAPQASAPKPHADNS